MINFNESVHIMADDTVRPGSLKAQKIIDNLIYWLKFFVSIVLYIGPFFLGIIVGMGIVLQDNKNKKQKEEIHWKLETFDKKSISVNPKTSYNLK
jgi:hypothetical protein